MYGVNQDGIIYLENLLKTYRPYRPYIKWNPTGNYILSSLHLQFSRHFLVTFTGSTPANSAYFDLEMFAVADLPTFQYGGTLDLMGLAHTVGLATIAFHASLWTPAVV